MDMGPGIASLKLANVYLKLMERVARFELVFIGLEGRGTTLIPYPQYWGDNRESNPDNRNHNPGLYH